MTNYRVGFSNMSEQSPFPVAVREGLEAAAAQEPTLELIVRNNDNNEAMVLEQAREFKAMQVDLALIFSSQTSVHGSVYSILLPIPVISIDIPIPMTTYFGVDNHRIGLSLAELLIDNVHTRWDRQIDKVIAFLDAKMIPFVNKRITSTVECLAETFSLTDDDILMVNGASNHGAMKELMRPVLDRWDNYHHIVGLGHNMASTLAMIDLIREADRSDDFVVVGQGGDQHTMKVLNDPTSPLIATANYHPEDYGPRLCDLIQRKRSGERLPQFNYVDIELVTKPDFPD